jgi:hypothetical protein
VAPSLRDDLFRKRLLADTSENMKLQANLRRHRQVFADVLRRPEVNSSLDSHSVESLRELESPPDALTKLLSAQQAKSNTSDIEVHTLSQQANSLKAQVQSLQATVKKLAAENKTLVDLSLPIRDPRRSPSSSPRPRQLSVSGKLLDVLVKAVTIKEEARLDDLNSTVAHWLRAKRVLVLYPNEQKSKFITYNSGVVTEMPQHSVLMHAFIRRKPASFTTDDIDFDHRILRSLGCEAVQMDFTLVDIEQGAQAVLLVLRTKTSNSLSEVEMASKLYSLVCSRIRYRHTTDLHVRALELSVESCDSLMQLVNTT